jgi:alpha-galactosidase
VFGAIEGHARNAGFDAQLNVLKFFGISALGLGAYIHGSTAFHEVNLLQSAKCWPESMLARQLESIDFSWWVGAQTGCWPFCQERQTFQARTADRIEWRAMDHTPASDESRLPIATAIRLTESLDSEGFPSSRDWKRVPTVRFDHDWHGENADPERSTEVRILWAPETLFLRFQQRYRTITVYPDARPDGWRDELWDRDVAEVFLQPDASDPRKYKEFEVSPNGYWIDLAISHGEKEELHSNLERRVILEKENSTWTAELAIPMQSLTPHFSPADVWRVNFYRVEGEREPRFYAAWSPTYSPKPNFHVPEAFGKLIFR